MKKFFCTLFFIMMFSLNLAGAASIEEIKQRGYLNISTNAEFEPFEYNDGNKILGIDIDIAKKIAQKLGVELKINDVSFDALIFELSGKKCDCAIAAMSSSEEKEKSANFSNPYYRSNQKIVVLNSSNIKSEYDLKNKKIGVQFGSAGDIYCTEKYGYSNIVSYNKISDASYDLENGNIDAVVVDNLPAEKFLNSLDVPAKILQNSLFQEDYRIAVPKGEEELLNYLNLTLEEMKTSGEINEIIKSYMQDSCKEKNDIFSQIYNNIINKNRYQMVLNGLGSTLAITVVSLAIGIFLGICSALIKVSKSKNIISKLLKFLVNIYVLVIRGTPVVVQLFVMYYLIFSSSGISKIFVAMITFGINSGAYVCEIIRSGISSIDIGQYEAGRCLGLNHKTTMAKIILPQAFKNILPTLISEFIQLIKETSVAGFIGIVDLSRAGDIIRSHTYQPLVPLMTVAIVYLSLVSLLTYAMGIVERRLKAYDKN